MSPRAVGVALAALLAACSRDLELPPENTLQLANPYPSVAPRETYVVEPAGGARPYAFSFAGGGAGSGPDATVDAASGAYTAGSLGPAIDVVVVRDASGASREARISVGPPLQVARELVFVAPGGRAGFGPTGGKPPYVLEIAAGPGAVDGAEYVAPASGGCTGTVSPPATAALRLRDATAATPIEVGATVGRGLDLFPAAGAGDVAPYEQIAFLASGGQPPYEFGMADDPIPSGGPGIDPGRGTYVAGPVGNVVDRVRVTDANGEQRCFDVPVGPSLSVSLSTSDIRPGRAMRIVASGGRAPYDFAFATKGNRSRGALDPVTGAYVPGLNALATDLVYVSDATGAPPLGPIALPVGPLQADSGPSDRGCAGGDFDRDGSAEAVAATEGALTVVADLPGEPPRVDRYARASLYEPVVTDLDGDGDADVAWMEPPVLYTLLGDAGGALAQGPSAFASTSPTATMGPVAAARGSGRVFTIGTLGPGACAGVASVIAFELDRTTRAFAAPICVAPATAVSAMAAGDFDGDGQPDVAYARRGVVDRVTFRLAASGYATPLDVLLPAPWRAERLSLGFLHELIEVRPETATASDLVAVVVDAPTTESYRTGLASFVGRPGGPVLGQIGTVQLEGTYNVLGVSTVGMGWADRPRIVAWSGADGATLLLDYPFTASPPAPSAVQLAPRPFRVGCVVGGDLDFDGVEDLLLAPRDPGPRADLVKGEGDGTFARHPRFASRVSYGQVYGSGDVDGDGRIDLVGASPGQGLEVLFLVDGQLAVSPETPLDGQFLGASAADRDGDGTADLVARVGATGLYLLRGLPSRDGRFAAPEPISVVDVSGAPFDVTTVLFTGAELGGAALGPDLLAIQRIGSQLYHAAIVFSDPTHATIGLSEPSSGTDIVPADLDGDGVDDVVTYASTGQLQAALVKPGDPRVPGWPFRPWIAFGAPAPGGVIGSIPVPGADPARRRVVAFRGDAIDLVDAPGGVPVATTVVLSTPVESYSASVGDVTGDGLPDLVVCTWQSAGATPWLVFAGTPDGSFEPAPRADLSFLPVPFDVFLSVVPSDLPNGAGDLLLDHGTYLTVLRNDGAGHFR